MVQDEFRNDFQLLIKSNQWKKQKEFPGVTPGRLPTLLCLICLTVFISTELSDGMSHKIRLKPLYIVAKMNLSSWYSWRGSEHLCDRSAFEWEMSSIWACFCFLTSFSLPPYFLHSSTHQKRNCLENMRREPINHIYPNAQLCFSPFVCRLWVSALQKKNPTCGTVSSSFHVVS